MTVSARGFWLLRGCLGRMPALGRSAVSPLEAPGAAGRAIRGFRGSGVRHDAVIISGTEMAKQIQKEIQQGVVSWISLGNRRPHLSIILVGDNPASHTYVRKKIKAATAVGIYSEIILKPKDVSQEELLDITDQLNMDPRVSGILVQLPLPDHVDERTVCNTVAPEKDVDGFHIINIGRLCLDQHSLIPATASAVWEIIKRTGIETFGKNVVVAGRSKNVGMPIAMLLHTDGEHERPGGTSCLNGKPQGNLSMECLSFMKTGSSCEMNTFASLGALSLCSRRGLRSLHRNGCSRWCNMMSGDATVTIAHRYTPKEQLKIHTLLADVIIVAAGIPKLITSDMVKEGAAVIDVGINYVLDPVTGKTKLVGDVDFEGNRKPVFQRKT
ncbi:bifunctional methylenetetrahydrofolate dehydrogenase/cyclohydrolase 2, mitochondrial isoform X2 [Phacochoerus africanus]|uniref:bifunctional methylenetetrahydrofolate dehydrogenase/cyclohydrolase 2, mitochondrial isoform X2 n=1 Tax=Phacochoerus africanus TaxID=41426 RepID=UPI001FDA53C5|nr:bifunctional methylenetetrahydrofolate dehydrogenase/cyclohydrolase 2, mitochondrial isoform X2 [Phacochoerus africanus]